MLISLAESRSLYTNKPVYVVLRVAFCGNVCDGLNAGL